MKKNIFILFAIIFAISACAKKNDTSDQELELNGKTLSAIDTDESSGSSVPVDSAKAWVKNYQKWLETHDASIAKQVLPDGTVRESPNSRTVWFGIDQLERMINRIKSEGGDGIRFYFASYGSQPTMSRECSGQEYNYSNLNTLLMVPTKKDNCIHRDYYSTSAGITATSEIENKGEMCPPPANCGNEDGATLIDP